MKRLPLTLLFLSLCFHFVIAQPQSRSNGGVWEKYNTKYNNPVYVVDGKMLTDSASREFLTKIDPQDITKLINVEGKTHKQKNILYITTATLKANAYKEKFSKFSSAYKKYLSAHGNKEGSFFYTIDEKPVSGGRQYVIETLYNLPENKIESVNFMSMDGPDVNTQATDHAMIMISTKK